MCRRYERAAIVAAAALAQGSLAALHPAALWALVICGVAAGLAGLHTAWRAAPGCEGACRCGACSRPRRMCGAAPTTAATSHSRCVVAVSLISCGCVCAGGAAKQKAEEREDGRGESTAPPCLTTSGELTERAPGWAAGAAGTPRGVGSSVGGVRPGEGGQRHSAQQVRPTSLANSQSPFVIGLSDRLGARARAHSSGVLGLQVAANAELHRRLSLGLPPG